MNAVSVVFFPCSVYISCITSTTKQNSVKCVGRGLIIEGVIKFYIFPGPLTVKKSHPTQIDLKLLILNKSIISKI